MEYRPEMSKQDVVLEVLADMPDANAAEVADAVADRYGIDVSPAYVRVCRSRNNREADSGTIPRPHSRTLLPAVRTPAPMPATVTPQQLTRRDSDDITEADEQTFALIDRVVEASVRAISGHPQQVISSPENIAEIEAVLNDVGFQNDYPDVEYESFWVSDDRKAIVIRETGSPARDPIPAKGIVPYVPVAPVMPRPRTVNRQPKKQKERGCEFCDGKRPVAPGTNLYTVASPVFPKPRILCQLHAMAESMVPGTNIRPYRLYAEQFSAGVLEPVKSPFEAMMDAAKSVVNDLLGPEPEEQAYP